MPKRPYPFDFYSHNTQRKFFMPDKEYIASVGDKTIKRLFEAAKRNQTQTKATTSCNEATTTQNDGNNNDINKAIACNQCFDTDTNQPKSKCDFCEKLNCNKCLQVCAKCTSNYCYNCIKMSYDSPAQPEYVCYSCDNH